MVETIKLLNPHSYEETMTRLKQYLEATKRSLSLELFDMSIAKANVDPDYRGRWEHYLLHGSTVEGRNVLSAFGDYMARTHDEIPYYRHADAVDGIDTAMYHIKLGDENESIEFFNFLHG